MADSIAPEPQAPSTALVTIVGVAAGALVANLYYAQPLIASIGPELGIGLDVAGSVVSVTQIGYGIGLFFLVSLADIVESRRLVLISLGLTCLGLIGAATSSAAAPFFIASFIIGICSTGAQVLLPFIAQLIPEARRGRMVGNVMAGLLGGIMLARPVALFVSASFGWRAVFWLSAALMLVIGAALFAMMPKNRPVGGTTYPRIIGSMLGLLKSLPMLRRRAAYQALMFGAFNLFWTAAPLMLADRFGLGEQQIGLFALAGAGGALAAPVAGRLADRGHSRIATIAAMLLLALSFLGTIWALASAILAGLVLLAVLIDAAVQGNQVVSQRMIFSVSPEIRGRTNALYMTITFMGGAIGSFLGTLTYHGGGWTATAGTGALAGLVALLLFAVESRSR